MLRSKLRHAAGGAIPGRFDVIVTGNLFGGHPLATGVDAHRVDRHAALGPRSTASGKGLYEPIHGSAPDIAGKGVPIRLHDSFRRPLMLRYSLGQETAAERIEAAVEKVCAKACAPPTFHTPGTRKVGSVKWRRGRGSPIKLPRMLRVAHRRGAVWSDRSLVQRMREEARLRPLRAAVLLDLAGRRHGPSIGKDTAPVKDCEGTRRAKGAPGDHFSARSGEYTNEMHPQLRKPAGKAIDRRRGRAAMKDEAVIILDPVNMPVIKKAHAAGIKRLHRRQLHGEPDADGMAGLFQRDAIEWMTTMTYQAASGAGAAHLRELASRWRASGKAPGVAGRPCASALDIDRGP